MDGLPSAPGAEALCAEPGGKACRLSPEFAFPLDRLLRGILRGKKAAGSLKEGHDRYEDIDSSENIDRYSLLQPGVFFGGDDPINHIPGVSEPRIHRDGRRIYGR